MRQPKICAYVQDFYAKQTYKNECMDTRSFMGLRVIIDSLESNGYVVEYAGKATVHQYDYVLVSLTSDCDWWTYISVFYRDWETDRKSTRLNSSHSAKSRMPSSA